MPKRRMHFITLMCAGPTNHNNGGWRHPDGDGHLVLDPARSDPGRGIRPGAIGKQLACLIDDRNPFGLEAVHGGRDRPPTNVIEVKLRCTTRPPDCRLPPSSPCSC